MTASEAALSVPATSGNTCHASHTAAAHAAIQRHTCPILSMLPIPSDSVDASSAHSGQVIPPQPATGKDAKGLA